MSQLPVDDDGRARPARRSSSAQAARSTPCRPPPTPSARPRSASASRRSSSPSRRPTSASSSPTPPCARAFITCVSGSYPDYADPAALYRTFAIRGGSLNYDDFEDPRITAALDGHGAAQDQHKRAVLTARAGDLIMQTLPWILFADPDTIVIMDKKITGAPSSFQYMGGPWAATIGANG